MEESNVAPFVCAVWGSFRDPEFEALGKCWLFFA